MTFQSSGSFAVAAVGCSSRSLRYVESNDGSVPAPSGPRADPPRSRTHGSRIMVTFRAGHSRSRLLLSTASAAATSIAPTDAVASSTSVKTLTATMIPTRKSNY